MNSHTLLQLLARIFGDRSKDWWVIIHTTRPLCTYYFGPFQNQAEAARHHTGYLEDLAAEGAENIQMEIKRCHPQQLTVCEE